MELLKEFDRRYLLVSAFIILAMIVGAASQFFAPATGMAGGGTERGYADTTAAQGLSLGGVSADAGAEKESTERKRVTRYYIDLEVPDVEDAMEQTSSIASSYNGWIKSSSFSRDRDKHGSLEVAIPSNSTDAFLKDVTDRWKVESRRKNVDDVTERYTELELELKNKRQELRRLESLMNRTKEVEDLIKIQERMGELRSRIQFLDNQLRDLDRKVEYTTVSIDYQEPESLTSEFDIRDSLAKSYQGLFASLELMIVGTGYLLPFILLGAIIYKGRNVARELRENE